MRPNSPTPGGRGKHALLPGRRPSDSPPKTVATSNPPFAPLLSKFPSHFLPHSGHRLAYSFPRRFPPRVPGKSRILIDQASIPAVTLCERALSGPPLHPSIDTFHFAAPPLPHSGYTSGLFHLVLHLALRARARVSLHFQTHTLSSSSSFYIPRRRRRRKACKQKKLQKKKKGNKHPPAITFA